MLSTIACSTPVMGVWLAARCRGTATAIMASVDPTAARINETAIYRREGGLRVEIRNCGSKVRPSHGKRKVVRLAGPPSRCSTAIAFGDTVDSMWTTLDSDGAIADFLKRFDRFHDACLREMSLVTE